MRDVTESVSQTSSIIQYNAQQVLPTLLKVSGNIAELLQARRFSIPWVCVSLIVHIPGLTDNAPRPIAPGSEKVTTSDTTRTAYPILQFRSNGPVADYRGVCMLLVSWNSNIRCQYTFSATFDKASLRKVRYPTRCAHNINKV